jgi:hypothetical protein
LAKASVVTALYPDATARGTHVRLPLGEDWRERLVALLQHMVESVPAPA